MTLNDRRSTTGVVERRSFMHHHRPPQHKKCTHIHTHYYRYFLTNPAPGPGSSCSRPDLIMVGVRAFPVLLGFGCSHIMNPSRCANKGRGEAGSCCMGKQSKQDSYPWSVSGLSKVPGLQGLPTWVYIIEEGVAWSKWAAPTIVVKHFAKPPPPTMPAHTHKPTRSRYTHPPRKSYIHTFGAP